MAAVGAAAAPVPAVRIKSKSSAVTKEETNRPKIDSATNGGVVTANTETRKRKPRLWFMGHKIAVNEGQEKSARAALDKARKAAKTWDADAWKGEMKAVLSSFRTGVSHGGADRFKKKDISEDVVAGTQGVVKAAVGALAGTIVAGRTPGPARAAVGALPETEAPLPKVQDAPIGSPLPSFADINLPGLATLRNRLRIGTPLKYLGGGSFGQVYQTTAVSDSDTGRQSPIQVAVKVIAKLTCNRNDAVECDETVAQEVSLLTLLAGSPGVVQLLSWSEGLFDLHLAFPMFPRSLHDYIHLGSLNLGLTGKPDMMPGMCTQLLQALSHVHERKIVHRDIKPANILVDDLGEHGMLSAVGDQIGEHGMLSAVGDKRVPKVVLADFGGACQLLVGASNPQSFKALAGGREVTTYQYRAPEMFVKLHVRSCSYATDVWAMGVTVVEMDLGTLPFGGARTRKNNMDEVFVEMLKVLFRTKVDAFHDGVRKDPEAFNFLLLYCVLQDTHALPWGQSRSVSFQNLLRKFFAPYPPTRPSAGTLARDVALPK